jgi:hypothetical protein
MKDHHKAAGRFGALSGWWPQYYRLVLLMPDHGSEIQNLPDIHREEKDGGLLCHKIPILTEKTKVGLLKTVSHKAV